LPCERFDVLGVPVAAVTAQDVLAFVRRRIEQRMPGQIVTVNAEFVMRAHRDPAFAAVLRDAALATPDGAGVVWAMRRQGAQIRDRVGGADLIWSLSEQSAQLGHRLFLLGGTEGVAAVAAERLKRRFPGLTVAGTYAGSPAPSEEASIVDLIRRSQANIVLVAFGAPAQDIWIARNLRATGAAIGMGVGGSFDYVAGTVRRAPIWMRQRGLEWLWRLAHQPWRLRRALALPRFAWMVWRSRERMQQ
jgi:N-acetylglucosaminyldiphosphoundecaprenol N-acetyl-beta-D-mannosaminyltransferase